MNGVERGSRFNTGNVGSLRCSYRENRRARSDVNSAVGFLCDWCSEGRKLCVIKGA